MARAFVAAGGDMFQESIINKWIVRNEWFFIQSKSQQNNAKVFQHILKLVANHGRKKAPSCARRLPRIFGFSKIKLIALSCALINIKSVAIELVSFKCMLILLAVAKYSSNVRTTTCISSIRPMN